MQEINYVSEYIYFEIVFSNFSLSLPFLYGLSGIDRKFWPILNINLLWHFPLYNTSLVEYLNFLNCRQKPAQIKADSAGQLGRQLLFTHLFHFCSKIFWSFQWIFLKIDVKIDFLDLNYLWIDTKHINFGWCWSLMVHEAYLLGGQME